MSTPKHAPFLHEDFLLDTEWAQLLYHSHAKHEPIYDYHCHLPPDQIAANLQFRNLTHIWLAGDHYKWRAMRAAGVNEDLITGSSSSDFEKYEAFCRIVPQLIRNPLHHWSHLEMRRYFGIDLPINASNAKEIWDQANAKLARPEMTTWGILTSNRVAVVCTTDDPADSLEHHAALRTSNLVTKVYPTFRADKLMAAGNPAVFNAWCDQLSARADVDVRNLDALLEALDKRHAYFHSLGGRLSDHGLESIPDTDCTDAQARQIFDKIRSGWAATPEETARWVWFILVFLGRLDAKRGWTKQMHLGALRSNNTRLNKRLGADSGVDSIGDFPQARALSRYLDTLDRDNCLPKFVLYNLNPADNYVFATMIGNFNDGTIPGKLQFGSGWWFLDQKEGMEWQMNALSSLGLLTRFVGMLTDSRSFLSYPRHEYFRRILCRLIGEDVEKGLIPADEEHLAGVVRDICFRNARDYFGLDIGKF
jgi:glucuronate isomerase